MFEVNIIDMGEQKIHTQKEAFVKITDPANFDIKKVGTSCNCTDAQYNKDTQQLRVTVKFTYLSEVFQSVVTYRGEDRVYNLVIKSKVVA